MMYVLLIVSLIGIDQCLKYIVTSKMVLYSSMNIWSFINITYIRNTGAAFGILEGNGIIFIIFTVCLIAVSVYLWKTNRVSRYKLSLSLIIAGAIGNCIDRITRGYVVDYIDLTWWPVFNFADVIVCVGTLLLAIMILTSKDGSSIKKGKKSIE